MMTFARLVVTDGKLPSVDKAYGRGASEHRSPQTHAAALLKFSAGRSGSK